MGVLRKQKMFYTSEYSAFLHLFWREHVRSPMLPTIELIGRDNQILKTYKVNNYFLQIWTILFPRRYFMTYTCKAEFESVVG